MKKVTVLLLGAMFFVGCGTIGAKKTDEDIVRERAQSRLDALIKGNTAGAWKFATPAYREGVAAAAYSAQIGGSGNWKSAEVTSVSCEPERCDVKVMITYEIKKLKLENTRPLEEVWIKTDGQWWIFHHRR